MSDPKLPTGRLGRLAGMARAGIGFARGAIGGETLPLDRAVDTLANLRGIATKVGQMSGIMAAMLPPEERAKAELALERLRSHTTTSPFEGIRAVIEKDLGGTLEDLFGSFDPAPFASASIGQVHRATTRDGIALAVKVQHPGIDVAIQSDLANASQIGLLAGALAMSQFAPVLAEVKKRFLDELDYVQEAAMLARFAEIVRGDPEVAVPALVPELSAARVLTTHFVAGDDVNAASRRPSARTLGRAIRRFLVTSWLDHGLLFGDPHAGNWIFGEDPPRVTVLDFGCVVPFEPEPRATIRIVLDTIAARGIEAAREPLFDLTLAPHDPVGTLLVDSVAQALAPLALDRPVTTADLERLARVSADAKRRLVGRRVRMPPWLPLTLRALVGTMALLATLEGSCA